MIVCKIELWPGGNEANKRMLGEIIIVNDQTGTADEGNYNVSLTHSGTYYGKKGVYKSGRVTGHFRNLSPYRLVKLALDSCGIKGDDV